MALFRCGAGNNGKNVMAYDVPAGKYLNTQSGDVLAYTSGTAINISSGFYGSVIVNLKNATTFARSTFSNCGANFIKADGTVNSWGGSQTLSFDVTDYDWAVFFATNWAGTITVTD